MADGKKYKEVKLGYVDCFHSKKKAEGSLTAPDFEGRIKTAKGISYIKLWLEPKEGVTGGEMLKGYIYKNEEE